MASWFSYIRNTIIGEELPSADAAQDGVERAEGTVGALSQSAQKVVTLSCTSPGATEQASEDSFERQQANSKPSLSQEQREHIKNVLRRAERSGRNANVVVDARHLKRAGAAGFSPSANSGTKMDSSVAAVCTAPTSCAQNEQQKEDDEPGQFFVQMDSLPEDVEVSVGPYSYCSYASSEMSYSEADKGYSSGTVTEEAPEGRAETATAEEAASTSTLHVEGEDGSKTIAQKMQKLSKTIDQWLKSLDREDSELALTTTTTTTTSAAVKTGHKNGDEHTAAYDAPCTTASAVFATLEQPTILLDYLDTLSQSICVMAIEHSANKLFERQFELVNQLSDAMANEVIESVLRLASSTIEEPSKNAIDEAAHLLLNVFNSVEQNEKLEIDVSLKALHSVDLKPISMDHQLETGDHNCYTILVEERDKRRRTEEAINFVPKMPTTMTTMRNGGGGLSSTKSSFLSTFESGSTSGADSEPSSSDSVDVGAEKMPFAIVPTEKEHLLDIVPTEKEQLLDIVPLEDQLLDIVPKVLNIVPKEEQLLDIVPKVLNIVPKEEQLLDIVPTEKELLDIVPKVLDIVPMEEQLLDIVPKEKQLLDIVPKVLDIVPMKEQLLDIVPTEKELLDIVPMEEQLLDIVPKEKQLLDIVPKVLDIVPMEEQLLDIVPKEKQLLDIVPKVLDIVPMKEQLLDIVPTEKELLDIVPMEEQLLDIVPKEKQLLDIVPKVLDIVPTVLDIVPTVLDIVPTVLDIVPMEEQFSLEDDEACSSSTSGADSHPETERDIHSPEDQLMERQHLLDTVTPKDEQKMDSMPTEEQPVHEHKTADSCSFSTPSTTTTGADSFHNAEFGANSFEEFDSKMPDKTEKETNRAWPPATIDDQTLDRQIKGDNGDKNGENTQIDEKIGVDLLEHFDWIKKIVENNSKEEESEKDGQTSQEEKVKDFSLNGQLQTARKMPKSFDSRASTITSGADMTSHASTPEIEEGIIGMDKEQQLPNPIEEEWAQIEQVQKLAEEQQAPKLTEEEWAQIQQVQRLCDEQQAPKLTEEELAQIEQVQRLADEQQAPKLTAEEWAQIERVQRLAEEQQPPKLTEEEWAQIEQVQQLAKEQQAPKLIEEELAQIEQVQQLAKEQQAPKLIEEELAQIEQVQRLAEEQQPQKLTEEELAQIEQIRKLAEQCSFEMMVKSLPRQKQNVQFDEEESFIESNSDEEKAQFEHGRHANDWCQLESLALKAANGGDNDEHEQPAEPFEHIARPIRQIDEVTINQSSLSLSPSTSSADSIHSSSGTEETKEGWPQNNGTRKTFDSAISDQIDDQTTSCQCQQPELPSGAAIPGGMVEAQPSSVEMRADDSCRLEMPAAASCSSSPLTSCASYSNTSPMEESISPSSKVQHQIGESRTTSATSGADSRAPSVESIERAEKEECTIPESGTSDAASRAPSVESIERAEKEECTMPESGTTSATSGAGLRASSVESIERAEKDECTIPESGTTSATSGADSRAQSLESIERAEKDECIIPESGTSGADSRAQLLESIERAEKEECTIPEAGTSDAASRAPSVKSIERAERDECTIPEAGTSGADSRASSVESIERAEKEECTMPESGTSGADLRAQSLESIERAEKDECTMPESGTTSATSGADSRASSVESIERAEKEECTMPESGTSGADLRAQSLESIERAEKDECTMPESGTTSATSGADSRAQSLESIERAEKDECTMPESGTSGADSRVQSLGSIERAERDECTIPESETSGADSRAPSVESVERAEKDEGIMRELLVVPENKTDSLNDMQSEEIEQLPDKDQLQEVSIDELAHIERIRQLAEQCSFEMMVKSVPRQKQNVQFEEDENKDNKKVYGEEKGRLEHGQEEWAQIEQVQEEQQAPKLSEEEWAQIEQVQRLAEEQQAPKLTEEEWAQIERVQRLAEEQQAPKLTEEEWAQIEQVQRLAEEQQAQKLAEEELAQIERVQRLAEEQQAPKLTEEEWAQIEQVQRLAEEQQAQKTAEEELAQIERVQRQAEEQQAPKLAEEELAQIERVQRLAEEQQAPKLTEEEWAQIERVQRMAEKEWAQIERVQRLAEEQQLPTPTEEWAKIEQVQEEQQAPKLTEEELAQIEQVQEEQQAPKLTEEELAQIEQVQEEQQAPKLMAQIEQVQRLAEEQQAQKLAEEELAQIERVQRMAEKEWAQIERVQRLAEEQQLPTPTEEWAQIEQVQEEQQAPKLTEEELAQIEQVQEEQQAHKLTEEELAQIEQVQRLAEKEWAQIERVQLAEACGSPVFEIDRRTFDKKDALIDKTDHNEHDEGWSSASTSSADSNPSLPGSSTDEHLDHVDEHINQLSGAVASVAARQKNDVENGGVLAQQRTEEECSLLPADESSSSLSTSGADSVQSFERPQLYEPSTPLLLSDHDMEPAAVDDVVHMQQQPTQKSPEMWPNAANFANNNLDEKHRGLAESLPPMPMPTVQCLAESICGEKEGKQYFSSKSINENAGRRHEMLLPANKGMQGELQQLHKTRQMSLTSAAMNSPSTRSRSSCSVMMMSSNSDQRRWLSFSRATSDIDDNNTSLLLIRPDDDAYAVAATGAVEEKRHKQYSTSSSTEKRHKQYSTSSSTEKRHKQYSTSSSTSSVNIVFTDHKLRRSFCVDHDEANAADVDIIVSSVVEDDGFQAVQSVTETTEEEVADPRKMSDEEEEDWANNIDFMIKLNFFAQRLSEEIADEAARDITNIIHIKQNPRALYFDDKYCELLKVDGHQLHDQICSSPDTADDGWDGGAGGDFRTSEQQDPLLYEVREMANDEDGGAGRGGRLKQELISQLSVFTGLMRRRSAATSSSRPWSTTLTPFLAPRATTFSSSTATSAAKRKESIAGAGESGGGIMELLRRPSTGGTLEEGGADELPESALAGLSREEREHILKVVAESRRSPSAQASRSSSCSLHVRSEQVESKPQWTKPIEDATTQFSSTEIQQRISNDQQQRPEEVQEVHSIGMKIFDGENPKELYEVSKMEEFSDNEPEEIQEVSKTEEFLENLSKMPEELNVEYGAVSCGDYLPTKTEKKIEVESAKEAIMDDDVEPEEDEAVQSVNEFLHSENQNPPMAPLDVPTVMEDEPVDGMAMAMETYQQQMAKPAEAGWMSMFTRVEKKAKQIGTSMPSSIQSISAQMDLIKRNVDIQSLSDQFKRITDKKDILTEHSEKPAMMNNEHAEVHALTDPSMPSFWARNVKGTTVEEQHLVIDHAKNAAVVDASRSSSSGFGDTIDDQQMCDDDGESFWHGQHRASVEQTARFVSSEINLLMDNALPPLFSETDQEQAILPPPAGATFEVPAQIVNETEYGIVKGPVSRPTDSAAPPPFCTSICAKNAYGGLAPGADGGAPRAEEKEIEHFGWERPEGTMEEEGDGRTEEMDDDKWTKTKQKLEEKEEEEMAKMEEKNFVWKHQRPGAEALEGNEHFGTTTTMEEKEEEEEGSEEAYEEQREESKGGGRGRSIDWKCQEKGENLSANGRDGRPPPPPLLAPSEEAAAAQPLAAEDILALLAHSFAPGATVGISTPPSKSIWLEDGREIGGLESSKAYESAAGSACNSSSSSGRGGAPFSVCLPPSSPAATSAATAAAAAEANPFSLPQFPSPPAVKGENQKTKQKVAFTGAAQQQHSHTNGCQRDEAVHVHGEELGSEETRFVRSADEVVGAVPWAEDQLQDHSRVPTPFVAEDEQPQQHQSAASIKTFPPLPPFTLAAQSTPLSIGKMFFSSTTSAGGGGGQKQQQQQTSSSFAGFGNKFGKLASDTLKGAKQAKEKAVTAMAQAGQTLETAMNFPAPPHQDGQPPQLLHAAQFVPQRPHSSLGLPIAGQSSEMPSKSSSLYDISLPPGFDLLSEEEQLRIISVMQCAELDAQLDATNANAMPSRAAEAATKTDDKQRSTVVVGIAPADSLGIVPSADLDQLSQAEEAVHAAVVAAVDGQKHERHHDGTAGIEFADEVMEGEAEDAGHAKGGVFMDTSPADGLDLAQYGQPMGMFRVETGDDHRRVDEVQQGQQYQTESGGGGEEDDEPWMQPPTHKFTAPLDQWEMPIRTATSRKQLWTTVFTDENDQQQQQQQQPKAQPSSDEELGEDELLEQISMDTVRGCWESSSGRAGGTDATISGRSSTSSRSKMVDPEEQQMENELTKVARSIYTADFRADNQHYHVQNGKNEQEELKKSQQQQQQNINMVDNRRIVAEHAHNNSYEIEMDDPWSPTLNSPPKSTIMEAKKAMTTAMAHSVPPIITVTTTDDAGSGVEHEEDSEEDDDVETADERRRHSSSSSEEEEDGDYPDTVQSVPTVSPATIAELQERQEMEQQQMVAQVFQQIQAFGEAADDEFDVQWAKPKQNHQQQHLLRKVVIDVEQQQQQQRDNFFMEDQANVYSPPEVETEAAATKIGFIKYADAIAGSAADDQLLSSMSADQMTENGAVQQNIDANSHATAAEQDQPVLNDEDGCSMRDDADEDEDDDGVHDGGIVVRQVLLDADDRSAEELERYYKSQLDQSIYFAPRPGPVYTIPEMEEEEMASAPNREAIYHAERIERKPLHSGTVPALISPEAIASTFRRKSGGSIGRSTAVVVVPPCTVTPTFDAIVAHAQPLPSSASRTTTTSTSSTATTAAAAHLTPVRMAPPPPPPDAVVVNLPANDAQFDQRQQQSMPPLTAMSAKPLSAAIHLQHQLQQLNQHKFDTNIAQQNDLPPPQWHNASAASINGTMPPEESGGGGGVAAVVVPTDAAATASTRLKRSPAMILTGQCDLKSSSALATAIKMPNGHILGHGEERHNAVTTMAEFNHTHGRSSSQQQQQQNSLSKVRKSASTTTSTAAAATDPFQLLLCQHQIVPTTQQTAALVISNSSVTTNAAASSEMGRRRLPSLPTVVADSSTATAAAEQQQQRFFYSTLAENGGTNLSSSTAFSYHPSGSTATTCSTTTTISNLITYYTSSAPEKCDVAVNGGDVSLLNSSSESRVLFDANVVAYAQSAALGPAPWSSSSTSSGTKPFISSNSITETTMSTTTARTFGGGGGGQQQQHIDWPRSVEDLPQKGPVVIPGALYHHGPSTATRMYLPPAAAAERVPSQSMSPPRRRVQQQQQYRSRTLERADQETHAMLNFKRQLRQALEKRRKLMDLCDIEAGHREYVINKWLHSGILPTRHRSSDVDAIPPVIKCALPSELLANVGRIVPSVLPTQNVRRHGAAAAATSQRKTTPTTTAAVSSEAGPEKQQNTRTFGSQTGGSSPVHQAASRNTTANQLLHKCATGSVPRRPQNVSDASTQTALCAETQTDSVTKQFDGTSAELKWPSRLDHDLESHSRTTTTTSAYRHPQRGNYHWLHAPEEDERGAGGDMRRQKRHRSRLGRFLHTDTEWERQLRERQTQQELNMRREQQQRVRHHEMMEQLHQPGQAAADNGTLTDGGELLMTHYYPPPGEAVPASFAAYPQPQREQQQQHWTGSLPRLDHLYNRLPNDGGEEMPSMMMMSGAEHLPSSYLPDVPSTSYQQQQQQQQMRSRYGYSSLPRNYERSWGDQQQQRHFYGAGRPSPAFCPNFDYFGGNFSSQSLRQQPFQQQQHFGTAFAAGGSGRYSKSVQDLDQFGRLTAADNDRWWYSPSQMGASAAAADVPLSRSVNCLDRLGRAGGGYLSDDTNQQFHGNSNAMFHRRPATNGTMNMATSSDRLGLGGQRAADHNALLSNYANFLNNQFMLEQQHQRELDDRELMMANQQLELGGQRQLDERMMEVVPPVMLEHPAVQLQHHAEECQKVLPPPLQTMPSASLPHPAAASASATALGRLPPCLYSRGEHNYGVRPPPDQYEDYGNLHWRNGMLRSQQQQPLYGQQDWINNNNNNNEAINYAYGAEQYHQPQVLPMSTAPMVQHQLQQMYMAPPPISALSSYQQQPHISRLSWPSYQRQQQAQIGAVVWPNEQQQQQQQRHLSSAGDRQRQQQQQQQIRHPTHGILRRPRNSPPCSWTTAASNSNMPPSSDFYDRRDISRTPRGCFVDTTNRPINNNNSRNVVKASRIMAAENCFRNRSAETKRILLTRHYKHENIFKDLGIRVVGGKKLSNGDLGAFITMLDTSKAHETLGELREGDQILEWNGVLLGGKTFEEVERVIQASNLGEIELIVRSRRNLYDNGGELEDDEYRLNGADNECRGIFGGPGGENGSGEFGRQQRQTSTRKNIAFADSTKNGSNWHSPSEPPPIPAHRAQHNNHNHTNTNQQQNQSSTTTDEWCPEIKWPPSSALRRKGCGGGGGGGGTMPSPHSNDDGYGDGGVGVEHVGGGGGGGGHASAGHLQVAIAYDRQNWVLSVRLIAAHGLATCGQELPNPFIKVYLLPERKVSNKRRTKYVPASCNPIWDQLVEYSIPPNQLERHYLELTVLDYDRHTVDMDSRIIGQVLVGLGDPLSLNGTPKWLALQCAPPVSASMRNCSPLDTHFQLPTRTYYNPAVLDLLDGYPAIA
uniref:Uncharacterized protein n=1 Tax=Globodera rostochiensis TaxID=31243 RepID=A0A914I3J2_GLORO